MAGPEKDSAPPLVVLGVALDKPETSDQHKIAKVFIDAAALCLAKNEDYGSSFRRTPILAPEINAMDAVLVRIGDKDLRFANLSAGSSGRVGESRLETMTDAACYRLLWCLLERERLSLNDSGW